MTEIDSFEQIKNGDILYYADIIYRFGIPNDLETLRRTPIVGKFIVSNLTCSDAAEIMYGNNFKHHSIIKFNIVPNDKNALKIIDEKKSNDRMYVGSCDFESKITMHCVSNNAIRCSEGNGTRHSLFLNKKDAVQYLIDRMSKFIPSDEVASARDSARLYNIMMFNNLKGMFASSDEDIHFEIFW